MKDTIKQAFETKKIIAHLSPKAKNSLLLGIADNIDKYRQDILSKNSIDVHEAKKNNLQNASIDRLILDDKTINDMIKSIKDIASLQEPVGKILSGWRTKDNLNIQKITIPIGVVAVIYESRPNVTSDVVALCIKSGNVIILKGGKEAKHSNKAIIDIIHKTIKQHNLPKHIATLLENCDKQCTKQLLTFDDYIDMIVPRGGQELIKFVSSNSCIPVVKHDRGLCHTYIHKSADIQMAIDISINAKTRRVEICGAMESLLVDKDIAEKFLPLIQEQMEKREIVLRGCDKTLSIINIDKASKEDFDTEYLCGILSIKIVSDIDEAILHINTHGSQHSDAIVSSDYTDATKFLNEVDSSCVYLNSSTQFTDGAQFGFGAEIGISTNRLHSRGPMGINDLTTYKYIIKSNGATRK
ncbi:MAG: glutamate-5-semialdehyde dehydrogenase [Epsilonproteobacteria bacterium]|nr:MAG: glutamate-5-semialdehyde dehydrogenase [Campylobacterota bacterium]